MISATKFKLIEELLAELSSNELIWLNGYINGFVSQYKNANTNTIEPATTIKKLTVVFGTETGNSKKLATALAAQARQKGAVVKLTSIEQLRFQELPKEENLFFIISTHGEGEPPSSARKFYEFIHQTDVKLTNTKYSVLALGDSSYPLFCKAGEDIDRQLEKLGANRIVPLQKCDVDYEDDAALWFANVLKTIETKQTEIKTIVQAKEKTSGRKIYNGSIINNINLNDRGSNKATFHIEIAVDEAADYKPGDALAVLPKNRKEVVGAIIELTSVDPNKIIQTAKHNDTVQNLLTEHLNICYLHTSTIKKYAALTGHEIPDVRMDLIDLLRIFPLKSNEQFVDVIQFLFPVAPRLYTISSSPAAHEREIHITVSKKSFVYQNEQRFGLCSEFLGDMKNGSLLRFYIHKNKNFSLPEPDKNIIMVGPGTGIAPFRSFLAERNAMGSPGKNWLFFGEQHFVTDFLYQTELQDYLSMGVLNQLTLAFSRDEKEKKYVQHRMLVHGDKLIQWLNNGAYFYVSGNRQMANDVEQTLLSLIGKQQLQKLKTEDRYQTEIY